MEVQVNWEMALGLLKAGYKISREGWGMNHSIILTKTTYIPVSEIAAENWYVFDEGS